MFKWYRDCHVCIAYLAESTSVNDLVYDVWFTRGWTLQELVAPKTMKFYGKDWVPISNSTNDKQDPTMMNVVSRATGIPLDDLRCFRPGTRDVHTRMMWASTRTTTRIEDIAYCLIGIFDVSMTVAYGEGKRAFYRLIEAIIHRCGEWQIMAWAGKPSADSAALPDSPRCFRELVACNISGDGVPFDGTWRGDRHFFMTKKGLQLRVLLVSFPSMDAELHEGVDHRKSQYGQCTVGVVDYFCYDTSGQGVLRPMQDHLCLLLHSDPFDPFMDWHKVKTSDLLFVRANREKKGSLTTVWL
ncbi:hypothetical protein ID866_10241 [Astraeus odoratus]|nr:hypothetical protein ID866_10241 [Astraeus odoratus]